MYGRDVKLVSHCGPHAAHPTRETLSVNVKKLHLISEISKKENNVSQFFYETKKRCCSKDDSLGSDCKKINVNITSSGSLAVKFLFIHRKDCFI